MVTARRSTSSALSRAAICCLAFFNAHDRFDTRAAGGPVTYEDLVGISDLGVLDGPNGIAVSPDRTVVALQVRQQSLKENAVRIRWYVIPIGPRGPIVDAGSGGDVLTDVYRGLRVGDSGPEEAVWSPDSQYFVYRAMRDGQLQLWASRRDGTRQWQLTHCQSDIEKFSFALDGRKILFSVGPTRSETRNRENDLAHRGYLYDSRFSPLYSREPLKSATSENQAIWVYELSSGGERLADAQESEEFARPPRTSGPWGSASRFPYQTGHGGPSAWLDDVRPGAPRGVAPPLTVVATPTGRREDMRVCESKECTGKFGGVWISRDGGSVVFLRWSGPHEYGGMVLDRWRVGVGDVTEIFRTEGVLKGCVYLYETLLCGYETATQPCYLVSLGLSTGQLTTVFDPNEAYHGHEFGRVTTLRWKDSHGVPGFGHLVKPINYVPGHRYPLIIVQYRSKGFLRGGVGDEFPIQVFAAKGFAVLSFQRPEEWELEQESYTYDDVMEKGWVGEHERRRVFSVLLAGLDLVASMGVSDPTKVGITGMSDGGETVDFALLHAPERFSAAASSWTPYDPVTYYLAGPNLQPMLRSYGFDDPLDGTDGNHWREISLSLNAKRVKTPVLLQVTDSELLCETQTFAEMQRWSRPIEMHVFPNEYHVISQPLHRYFIYKRSVQWFEFWLEGKEDDDPVDSDQYARWRKLRLLGGTNTPSVGGARSLK